MREFSTPTRVYIEDTDAGGVVFYANYLRYLERARTEALRSCGISLPELQHEQRRLFVVKSIKADYLAPARLDDELTVHANMIEIKRASLVCQQPVFRGDQQLLESSVILACIDADTGRAVRLPDSVLGALGASVTHSPTAGAH